MQNRKQTQRMIANVVFLAPALILFFSWVILPFLQGIPISMTDWDGLSTTRTPVGFDNYFKIFTQESVWNPARNTLVYTVISTLFSNVLGLLLALGVMRGNALNNALRSVYFLPHVLSVILCAYIWKYIYSDIGYAYLRIKSPLGNASQALYALAGIAVWRDSGYAMIIYIAALKMVPQDFYEAATVEGAGAFHRFFCITLPLIVPSITANLVLLMSWGFKQFDLVMAATGGGPGNATETLTITIYKSIFQHYNAGLGQATAVVFTIMVATISGVVSLSLRKREVEY